MSCSMEHLEYGKQIQYTLRSKRGREANILATISNTEGTHQKPYPMPKLNEMLLRLEGFQYATSFGLNMGCYHIKLRGSASKVCTTILKWGKHQYKRLPMGVANSPKMFQHKMNYLYHEFELYVLT